MTMGFKWALLIACVCLLHCLIGPSEAAKKNSTVINWQQKTTARPKAKSLNQLDTLISMCYRSQCKDWMDECHWFCDQIKGKNSYWRCMECLSSRGQHCFDCFEL